MKFTGSSKDVARFVADILTDSRFDLALITITTLARSEGCSVIIVTDGSLEGIAERKALNCSLRRTDTSQPSTQGGLSLQK